MTQPIPPAFPETETKWEDVYPPRHVGRVWEATSRLRVPGGWLYAFAVTRTYRFWPDRSYYSMAFVPDPQKQG